MMAQVFRKSRLRMNAFLLEPEPFTLDQPWRMSRIAAGCGEDTMTPDTLPITRRAVLRGCAAACAAGAFPASLAALTWSPADGRPSLADRHFRSPVIEAAIARISAQIAHSGLAAVLDLYRPLRERFHSHHLRSTADLGSPRPDGDEAWRGGAQVGDRFPLLHRP